MEQELARRLGKSATGKGEELSPEKKRPKSIEELALEIAPKARAASEEPMTAILAGIDEVPLAFEHRRKNIEEIERAKSALLGGLDVTTSSRPGADKGGHRKTMGLPAAFGSTKTKKKRQK